MKKGRSYWIGPLVLTLLFFAAHLTGAVSLKAETLETDIVVVGGGGSGLAAAVSAAENGAKVIVLEKRAVPGGITAFDEGMFGAESLLARQHRIYVYKDDAFQRIMNFSNWALNARLVREWVNRSGDTIDWLQAKGVKFTMLHRWFAKQQNTAYHVMDSGGSSIIKAFLKECNERGVQVLLKTPATKILTDEKGKVTGVLASQDGKEIRINAKAVVIGTGGFGGNREMLKKYYPDYSENLAVIGLPHMGDGINMATAVGAANEGLGAVLEHGPYPETPKTGIPKSVAKNRFTELYGESFGWGPLWTISADPMNVRVNKNGERFSSEYCIWPVETLKAVNRQPDKVTYALFDEALVQRWMKQGFYEGTSIAIFPMMPQPYLGDMLRAAKEAGNVEIADTWEGVAKWIGADPGTLKATIDKYNTFCDKGYDADFLKEREVLTPLRTPPFYALKLVPCILNTNGGIRINYRTEVLDKNDKPIPGLYAVGNDAGGWNGKTYLMNFSGNGLSFVITSGRMAGENAAKFVSGK